MNQPTHSLRAVLLLAVLLCYSAVFVGCGQKVTTDAKPTSPNTDDHDHDDHDHDDHDHEGHDHHEGDGHDHDDHKHADGDHDHEDHDHAHGAHGPNGGHLLTLEPGDVHAEWAHVDEKDQIMVYVLDDADAVQKVEMKFKVEGQEPKVFEFDKVEADGKSFFQIESPELLTAVKMGKAVGAKLVVTTEEGEMTGGVEHHAH